MSEENNVVTREMAMEDLQRFFEAARIDVEELTFDTDGEENFNRSKARLINSIMRGDTTVNEQGRVVFTPESGTPLVFRNPNGGDLRAMSNVKEKDKVGQMYAVMASVTQQPQQVFNKMPDYDLKVCNAVFSFFTLG